MGMIVGVLKLELAIYEAQSLKDKRRVLKSLKDRLAARGNVSVAEVDHEDSWQRSTLGVALVANDATFVHSCLDRIVDFVRGHRGLSMIDYEKDLY